MINIFVHVFKLFEFPCFVNCLALNFAYIYTGPFVFFFLITVLVSVPAGKKMIQHTGECEES